jgi:excisionase family DNA binding protein
MSTVSMQHGQWLSVKEVSAILGCSVDTIRRLVKSGRLKAIKLTVNATRRGWKRTFVTLRIHTSEVDRFIMGNAA